ncbi:hypothetical protein G9A89_011393 [Geosiphon pyriformis]|nr:hypothetical protein G9A89_011393 [Geosiphon pyriformis]
MESGFNIGVKSAESRKKRKGGALEDNIDNRKFAAAKGFETGDTTESDNVDIEEEFLVEKTSFDYGKSGILAGGDLEQTPKSLKILTKRVLSKPLGKIDFLSNNNDDILLDKSVVLPSSLKNLVNVSVKKSFTLDISLNNVIGKSAQKKLMVIRKLFSKINGFGGASTLLKFAGIIRVTFTSELSLVQVSKKAKEAKILVNTDLKKSSGHSNWAVVLKKIPIETSTEAVHAVLSKFGLIKSFKMQLIDHANLVTAKWSILIGKDAVNLTWTKNYEMCKIFTKLFYYVASVGGKTCVIDCYLVSYAWTRCTTVCFDSAESLDAVIETTSVLKWANLHWSCLVLAKYAGCEKLAHTLLTCSAGGKKNVSSGALLWKTLSNSDKSRLAVIYAKCLAPVAHPVSFGGVSWAQIADGFFFSFLSGQNILLKAGSSLKIKPTPLVFLELNDRFAALEHSLTNLAEHVNMLAKRLDTLEPMVSQLSSEHQPLVTSSSQNQEADIVMNKGSSVTTSGKTVIEVVVFDLSIISKMEKTLNNLSITIMSFSAKMDNSGLVSTPPSSQ